jgi:hypothetical protein
VFSGSPQRLDHQVFKKVPQHTVVLKSATDVSTRGETTTTAAQSVPTRIRPHLLPCAVTPVAAAPGTFQG